MERTYSEEKRIVELQEEIQGLQARIDRLQISKNRAEEVLEFHLEQLQKLGLTLEDSVCEVLRTLIEQSELQEQIEKKKSELRIITL